MASCKKPLIAKQAESEPRPWPKTEPLLIKIGCQHLQHKWLRIKKLHKRYVNEDITHEVARTDWLLADWQGKMVLLLIVVIVLICFLSISAHTASEWKSRTIYQLLTDRFAYVGSGQACSNLGNYCGGNYQGLTANLDYGSSFYWIIKSPFITNSFISYSSLSLSPS